MPHQAAKFVFSLTVGCANPAPAAWWWKHNTDIFLCFLEMGLVKWLQRI